jgi:hypothetical protein
MKRRALFRRPFQLMIAMLLLVVAWGAVSLIEWGTGRRVLPWSAYAFCGHSHPPTLPGQVRLGLYEEFPVPWRLEKLRQVDFPVTLAVAAKSRDEFLALRASILQTYPQVQAVYFWPLLAAAEGYYPGAWSDAVAVRRVAAEAEGQPTLWDSEMPLGLNRWSLSDWWQNRTFVDQWLRQRSEPVQIWRSHAGMGLNPLFLRLVGLQFDPAQYAQVSLQLDLYTSGEGQPREALAQILRCGVETYGERFVPSFGALDDGEGPSDLFVPPATLRRNLQLAREAGVSEIWLFGVNGLNAAYVSAITETLPVQPMSGNQ